MKKILTSIEKLDQRFPGLAAKVRMWFDQGISVQKVSELLLEEYQVSVSRSTVGRFRTRRWVPERELRQEKEAQAAATAEFARMQEMQSRLDQNFRGVEK